MLDKANINGPTTSFLIGDHYDTIDYFDKKIAAVNEQFLPCIADDPVVKQLLLQPGVGVITAVTMRALIGRFDRFRNGKQLANFCAITPRNNSTGGKTTTGGLIKAGDELLRQVLVESAHRLMRYDPHWRAMAARLRESGKKTCVIVAAVANRWVRRLFYQMGGIQVGRRGDGGFFKAWTRKYVGREKSFRCREANFARHRKAQYVMYFLGSVIPSSVAPRQSRVFRITAFRGTWK